MAVRTVLFLSLALLLVLGDDVARGNSRRRRCTASQQQPRP